MELRKSVRSCPLNEHHLLLAATIGCVCGQYAGCMRAVSRGLQRSGSVYKRSHAIALRPIRISYYALRSIALLRDVKPSFTSV